MNIIVDKKHLEALVECVERNGDFLAMSFLMYIHDEGLQIAMEEKLDEIEWYLKQVYDPERISLKRQARTFYQKWLSLRNIDEKTASTVYLEYLRLKDKIKACENIL